MPNGTEGKRSYQGKTEPTPEPGFGTDTMITGDAKFKGLKPEL